MIAPSAQHSQADADRTMPHSTQVKTSNDPRLGAETNDEVRVSTHDSVSKPDDCAGTMPGGLESPVSETVILTMGLTGVGKSTFIHTATKDQAVTVGHGLHSSTKNISSHTTTPESPAGNTPITYRLIDMPGFDDTTRSTTDIFLAIVTFLCDLARSNIKISGILYFHRISDDRMGGTSIQGLRMFQALCGSEYMRNAVFLTTHWDNVKPLQTALDREEELKTKFWADMIAHGARVERFDGTRSCAMKILRGFESGLEEGSSGKAHENLLAIQREIVVEKRELPETSAGKVILDKWMKSQKNTQEELAVVEKQLKKVPEETTKPDSAFTQELLEHAARLQKDLEQAIANQTRVEAVGRKEIEEWEKKFNAMAEEAARNRRHQGGFWEFVTEFSQGVVNGFFEVMGGHSGRR